MKFTIKFICLAFIYILLSSHLVLSSNKIQNSIRGKITIDPDKIKNYQKIVAQDIKTLSVETVQNNVKSNVITAAPYKLVLDNVRNFFAGCPKLTNANPSENCKKKIAEADAKVQELRGKDIDTVASYFNTEINSVDEYWFKYYILANVALRGKLVGGKPEAWLYNPSAEQIKKSHTNLLNEAALKNYQALIAKDSEFGDKLAICKRQTLAEIINKKPSTKEWTGPDRITVELRDFDHNLKFMELLKGFSFFQNVSANFPKGVIHHFHWSAGLTSGSIEQAVKKFVSAADKNRVLIRVDIASKDRSAGSQSYRSTTTGAKTYLKMGAPKFYIINDFAKVSQAYKADNPRVKYLVKNFVKDNLCNAFEGSKVEEEKFNDKSADDRDYYYFALLKNCKNSNIYPTSNTKELVNKQADLKSKIKDFDTSFKNFLDSESNILKTNQELMENYLPESYQKIIMNVKENISAAVWYLFENIFDMLGGVFDQEDIYKELDQVISKAWKDQKVLGVEYRQKNKNIDIITSDLKKDGILYAFQAPAIKLRNSKINRITSLTPDAKTIRSRLSKEDQAKVTGEKNNLDFSKVSAEVIKKIKEDIFNENMPDQHNYVGFDFIGYEDDPFNGARNFFPVSLQKVLKNHEKGLGHQSNQGHEDRFTPVFELSKKMKLQLHAGETAYLPDLPVDDNFLNKFYVNDHLFNAALLPNVERIGHGFGVARNGLIQAIFALKNISLEVCPISNETLRYYDVYDHPFPYMLRKGLKMGVSPDDPGFFGYEGVAHDWFKLMMETDLKPSEYFLLVKHSIEKAGDKMFRTEGKTSAKDMEDAKKSAIKVASDQVLEFFTNLSCKEPDANLLKLRTEDITARKQLKNKTDKYFENLIRPNYKDVDVMTSVYNKKDVIRKLGGIKALNLFKVAVVKEAAKVDKTANAQQPAPAKPAQQPAQQTALAKPAQQPAKPAQQPAKPAQQPAKPAQQPAIAKVTQQLTNPAQKTVPIKPIQQNKKSG